MIMMPKELKTATKAHRTAPYPSNINTAIMSPQTHNTTPLGPSLGNERPSTAWSQQDDQLLMQSRAQGLNWTIIAQQHFATKTPNACRKRHERLMEKRNAENWDGLKLEDLAKAYFECREMMWKIIADKVGEKWQHVESKCMEKGLKTLQAAARPNRRNKDSSPTSPNDENEPSFDDSGLGPDQSGNDHGNLDSHSNQHQSSHHQQSQYGPSSHSTPGGSYANPQSGYHSRGSNSRSSISSACPPGYNPSQTLAQQHQQQTLPSFSSGFPQLPSLPSSLPQLYRPPMAATSY